MAHEPGDQQSKQKTLTFSFSVGSSRESVVVMGVAVPQSSDGMLVAMGIVISMGRVISVSIKALLRKV